MWNKDSLEQRYTVQHLRRMLVIASIGLAAYASSVEAQVRSYPRDIFVSTASQSAPAYEPERLSELLSKRHEMELQMFDIINEAALRRDNKLRRTLDTWGDLGYRPSLAVAHYKWVFGDKRQLDWLLAEDRRYGWGADSLTLLVFAYMDEWDKTIQAWKARDAYLGQGSEGGATGALLYRAFAIRKRLYGNERFEKAWQAAK